MMMMMMMMIYELIDDDDDDDDDDDKLEQNQSSSKALKEPFILKLKTHLRLVTARGKNNSLVSVALKKSMKA